MLLGALRIYFIGTSSGSDGGNRTRYIAVYTWRLSLLSYGRDPTDSQIHFPYSANALKIVDYLERHNCLHSFKKEHFFKNGMRLN